MLNKILMRLGLLSTTMATLFFCVILSLFFSIIVMLVLGEISSLGLIMSIAVPSIISPPIIFVYAKALLKISNLESDMRRLLTYDPLTGVLSRRMMNEFAQELLYLAERENHDLCFLYCDLDYFKKINDTYGHLAGDFVLKETGSILKGNLRKSDLVGRLGGEEFLVILPETDNDGASFLAEKIRKAILNNSFVIDNFTINITISIGICNSSDVGDYDLDLLISKADTALYQSKANGRNRVTFY